MFVAHNQCPELTTFGASASVYDRYFENRNGYICFFTAFQPSESTIFHFGSVGNRPGGLGLLRHQNENVGGDIVP